MLHARPLGVSPPMNLQGPSQCEARVSPRAVPCKLIGLLLMHLHKCVLDRHLRSRRQYHLYTLHLNFAAFAAHQCLQAIFLHPYLPSPALLCTQVKEPLLVRDVLYACQGIAGKFTEWHEGPAPPTGSLQKAGAWGGGGNAPQPGGEEADPGGGPDIGSGYGVIAGAGVTAVESQLLARLTELGWLFRCVKMMGPWRFCGGGKHAGGAAQT